MSDCKFGLHTQINQSIKLMITPKEMFLKEMHEESLVTRKMLERIPEGKFGWKPHQKSMSMKELSNHVAELPSWVEMILTTSELDFSKQPYEPNGAATVRELIDFFESCLHRGKDQLTKTDEKELMISWALRNGETIFKSGPKWEFIRHTFCQITHHRAQLGVYLRLLDVPLPSSYGGSADDQSF